MAKLAAVVESLDGVDEPLRGLYSEVDGKYVLDADVEGHPQIGGLKSALEKERKAVVDLKRRIAAAVDPEEVERLKTELEELRNQKHPDVDKLIQKRVQEVEGKFAKDLEERDRLRTELRTLKLDEKVKAAALKAGVLPEDIEDVLLITKRHFDLDEEGKIVVLDDDGDPTGKTPDQWFADVFKQRKPKFFAGSNASGTGARGNGTGGSGSLVDLEKLPPAERITRARAAGVK